MVLVERGPEAEWPLTTQVQLLSLNRSSLYYRPVMPPAEELALKRRIDEIYTAHPFYGVRRITAQLRREGAAVNHKAGARPLRDMGLAGTHPTPNPNKRHPDATIHSYLLRCASANAAHHAWCDDM